MDLREIAPADERGRRLFIPTIDLSIPSRGFRAALPASEGAVAVVAHSIAFAAHAVAERRGLPLFVVTLSPLMLYSAYDPPLGTRAPFVAAPCSPLALAYNRALLRAFAWGAALWAAPLRKFRREIGLPRRGGFDLFAGAAPGVRNDCAGTRGCWRRHGPITPAIF